MVFPSRVKGERVDQFKSGRKVSKGWDEDSELSRRNPASKSHQNRFLKPLAKWAGRAEPDYRAVCRLTGARTAPSTRPAFGKVPDPA